MKVVVLISVLTISTICCTIGLMVWVWTDSTKGGNRSNISEAKNNNTSESDNENHNELGNENEILSTNINSEYNEEEIFDICDPCEKSKPKNFPESSPGSICNGFFSSTEENLTAELPVFGYGTEDTYNSCHDLEVDLRSAASIIINQGACLLYWFTLTNYLIRKYLSFFFLSKNILSHIYLMII